MQKLLINTRAVIVAVAGIVCIVAISACGTSRRSQASNAGEQYDSVLVDTGGNKYIVRKMRDGNIWMTTNLKLSISGTYCYNDSAKYCEKYGRLYTWDAAQKACSLMGEGWRLPSKDEWQQLALLYGMAGKDSIDTRKRAFYPLLYSGDSQFNALLSGGRNLDGSYGRLEAHGFYWTATPHDSSMAWFANFAKGSQSLYHQPDGEIVRAFAVRCVKHVAQ